MTQPVSGNQPVLFFDGDCNLCNGAVQFIIRRDPEGKVKFATLQSPQGEVAQKAIIAQLGYVPDSLIFWEKGRYYTRSAAALKVAGYLKGGWPVLKVFLAIPGFLRNGIYNFIAANRYRWFGRQDTCMLPTPELQRRFLSDL